MKHKKSKEFFFRLASWLLKHIIQILGDSTRLLKIEGHDVLEDLLKNRRPVIFCFWHNRIFYSSWFLLRYVFCHNIMITVLISRSEDGELIARVVERWGGKLARGSTSRGGREALQVLAKALRQEKSSVVTTPDGPRGPMYHFQMGTVILSQLTQCEIVPICFAARPAWIFRSWDRFLVPRPFSKTVINIGKPYVVPRQLTQIELEQEREKLEQRMRAQVQETENLLDSLISQKG
ncbi:MAG: lysophospholipid acyltransferase family protein [Leptospiraceae bacterium]|nr:lysophospholipid acyltransferase family protein [Leptospiraceae bacterium]MDW8307545.1 lysophospholipid acyltransferase family protein [Leptospiraceae bacterium]